MQSIKQFLKKNRILFLTIGMCLLVNSLLSYSQGIQRETIANRAYLDFIANYPVSIKSVRVEPLFIIISFYLAKLLSSIISIVVLKFIITGLQLFIFYKLVKLFTNNNSISLLFTIILNFSFTFFSLQDNLLRNHFANTLFLSAFYFLSLTIFQLNISNKKSSFNAKYILLTSFFGGLLIYSHILPTLLFDLTLLGTFIIFIILLILSSYKNTFLANKQSLIVHIIKSIFLIGVLTLIIQLPYILKLQKSNASTTDYKVAGEIINKKTSTSLLSPAEKRVGINPKNENTGTTPIKKNISKSLLRAFRILFEFRLPGISILFTFLLAISIIYFTKNTTINYIPLLILWLITYFGTKVDLLFNIGVIPYRFSLMLIFSSLILLAMLFNILSNLIKNKNDKLFLIIIVLSSFLVTNLPLILNITLLKNYTPNKQQELLLKKVYANTISQTTHRPVTFSINGKSFGNFNKESNYLRNDTFFTSFNEKKIIDFYNYHHVNFVIFDHFKLNAKGSDLNTTINTNLKFYEESKYFQKINEVVSPYTHLSIFKYISSGNTPKNVFSTRKLSCAEDKACQIKFNKYIQNIDQKYLKNWIIEITEANNNLIITESIKTNNSIISLSYPQKISSTNNTRKITLRDIAARKNRRIPLIIHIPKAKLLIHHNGFTINRKELQKENMNELIIFGQTTSNLMKYSYINTTELKMLIALLFIVFILLLYTALLILNKKNNISNPLTEFTNNKAKRIIQCLIIFTFIDMLFFNILFIHIYKSLLHL